MPGCLRKGTVGDPDPRTEVDEGGGVGGGGIMPNATMSPLDDRRPSLEGRERAIVSKTNIGTVSKATLGKRLRDGVERTWAFPNAQIPS